MFDAVAIEPARTALLVLDVQNDVVANHLSNGNQLLSRIEHLVAAARRRGVRVIYVVVGFRPGYPEAAKSPSYDPIRQMRRLMIGTSGCDVHAQVAPQGDEPILVKHRVSAFAGTELDLILRVNAVDTLILCGVATSGVVLSTVRQAYDLDYRCLVVSDGCADRDVDVHRILCERVFPRQARVADSAELLQLLGG